MVHATKSSAMLEHGGLAWVTIRLGGFTRRSNNALIAEQSIISLRQTETPRRAETHGAPTKTYIHESSCFLGEAIDARQKNVLGIDPSHSNSSEDMGACKGIV